ncbi:homeodomain protein class 1 [Vairimorpha apis BRL 01]|uniref:Homeodomain protein class 1 n=1 Tax=Vairimorpha apis BRL 01 TaxID=1037528 RepID=T0LC12_9MICR|nr:homeodomain protein class 1 [Vairimorpha apis BRL 01]
MVNTINQIVFLIKQIVDAEQEYMIVVRVLKGWLERNILDPYPSEDQKEEFCEKTGLEMNQINNWFINARRRILPQLQRNYEKYI